MSEHREFAISVIIPLFNKSSYIRRTLESVLAQTFPPTEIIVIDDGSTDGSAARVREMSSPQIRLVEQPNAGPGPARNRGIAEATADWIAFLDGDDLWRPDHLATLAELHAEFPKADALATAYERVGVIDNSQPLQASDDRLDGSLLDYFDRRPDQQDLSSSSIAVRRTALRHVGDFGAFWPGEDFDYWARLALDHDIAITARRTARYLQQTGGLMEQHDAAGSGGGALQPIFSTLDQALANPAHTAKHGAIRQYRERLLRQNMRQALYRCAPREARNFRTELKRHGGSVRGWEGLLCWLPVPVLRMGRLMRQIAMSSWRS